MSYDELRALIFDGFRLALGLVWLAAGIAKWHTPRVTRESVQRLVGGSPWAVNAIAQALPMVEILLGGALVLGWQARAAAGISAAGFVVFAVLIGRAAIRDSLAGADRRAAMGGCGCFGFRAARAGAGAVEGPQAIARNFVLATLAMAVVSGP